MINAHINEGRFAPWLSVITDKYFTSLVNQDGVEIAARSCIQTLGEPIWYELSITRQVDCIDCYMAGWADSRRSVKDNFK